ncbi:MAG TPA: TolC family protein [Steroidobacteraceae bacterium]|nr:TolC family protein [Steroidobacteraceae bacterium]
MAEESLELQRVSYTAGRTSILQLIDAERSYSQARLGSAGAEAERLEDASNLLIALGGGWWASPVMPPAAQAVFNP